MAITAGYVRVQVLLGTLLVPQFTISFVLAGPKSISFSDFGLNCKESTFVDKSLFIKDLLEDAGHKIVLTAPRGFGKTANIQMLKAFLQLEVDQYGKRITSTKEMHKPIKDTPNYKLFQKLKIMDHKDMMEKHFGKYPVIHVDYKCVIRLLYFNETEDFFRDVLHETFLEHSYLQNSDKLYDDEKELVKVWCSDEYREQDVGSLIPLLDKLAKYLYKHFDRTRVVVLVDHYDSPVYNSIFDPDTPDEVLTHVINVIQMIFNNLKDDFYVETFLITGVSQVEESHHSNNNVIKRYEFLNEHRFVPYYGLTEDELFDVLGRYTIEIDNNIYDAVQENYGGYFSLSNITVHNVWAILQYLQKQRLDHVWARTSDIPSLHVLLQSPDIKEKLEFLLRDHPIAMELKKSFSFDNLKILRNLLQDPSRGKDHLWYTTLVFSFLFEHGFLTYDPEIKSAVSDTRRYYLPNKEVKEFLQKQLNG